ncbi:hypothetical protein [Formosa algae]|uniref:hypothetical protein n=1 Tax=Formosa algae TaxID=225843 RepID=UPI0011AEF253|nr:hypothetical protein [Formosa algae]
MKNQLLYFALVFMMFSSCSKKSYTALYQDHTTMASNATPYFLSKNLLRVEVIYTLNEPRAYRNGIDQALTSSTTKLTIEDPIKITNILVPDQSHTFVLTGNQIPDALFVDAESQTNPQVEGETISLPSEIIAYKGPYASASLTDTSLEAEAYRSVLEIMNNISEIKTQKDIDLTLKIVSFYKSQIKVLNEDFKPYIKKSKVKYTTIIDPTTLYTEAGFWSKTVENTIYHTINPKHIFENVEFLNDALTLQFPQVEVSSLPQFVTEQGVEGVVYRIPAAVDFTLSLKDVFVESDSLSLAQLGSTEVLSVKDLESYEDAPAILFKAEHVEGTQNFQEKIENLEFQFNDNIENSQQVLRKEYEDKLVTIDLLLKRLQERKTEL